MTAPIRDVIASLDTQLDDLRQARTWHAIDRTLDAAPVAAAAAPPAALASPLAVGAAVLGAAIVGAVAMWLALRTAPVTAPSAERPSLAVPARAPTIDIAAEPVEPTTRARTSVHIDVVDIPEPALATKRRAPRTASVATAPAAPPTNADARTESADELYRRAEVALAARDRASARDVLHRILATFPLSPLVDAARYDLALIAIADGDAPAAARHLDELVASGRDANIVAAGRRLRRIVARE